MEELLARCKETIKNNKEKFAELTTENENFKQQLLAAKADAANAEISDFVADRVSMDGKQKLADVEAKYAKEISDLEESWNSKFAQLEVNLAEAKQNSHHEIEQRDQRIEEQRSKIWSLEVNLSDLKVSLESSEKEREDLVKELSKAKHDAISAVREEELKKQKLIEEEWEKKLVVNENAMRKKVEDVENTYKRLLAEQEQQAQLAVEERELQKGAAIAEKDRKSDQLNLMLEQLKTVSIKYTLNIPSY